MRMCLCLCIFTSVLATAVFGESKSLHLKPHRREVCAVHLAVPGECSVSGTST